MTLQKTLKELIEFYIKINYEKHLEENNISFIEEYEIKNVINKFYNGSERKKHIKQFVLNGIQKITEQSNGHCDLPKISSLLDEIMEDEELVKTRVYNEILLYQRSKFS